jgi:delta-aminolevulinic acid dehydratase/porphobilinogen synthase
MATTIINHGAATATAAFSPLFLFLFVEPGDVAFTKMAGLRVHASLHHPAAREFQEAHIHASALIYPIFVTNRDEDAQIAGFAPNVQWGAGADGSFANLTKHLHELEAKG